MATFDDGTPLDAAKLQDLETKLVKLESRIPLQGPQEESGGDNYGNSTVNPKQTLAGYKSNVKMIAGTAVPFTIDFTSTGATKGMVAVPTAVLLTPARSVALPKAGLFSYTLDWKTVSNTSITGSIYLSSECTGMQTMNFYWLAICQ